MLWTAANSLDRSVRLFFGVELLSFFPSSSVSFVRPSLAAPGVKKGAAKQSRPSRVEMRRLPPTCRCAPLALLSPALRRARPLAPPVRVRSSAYLQIELEAVAELVLGLGVVNLGGEQQRHGVGYHLRVVD